MRRQSASVSMIVGKVYPRIRKRVNLADTVNAELIQCIFAGLDLSHLHPSVRVSSAVDVSNRLDVSRPD